MTGRRDPLVFLGLAVVALAAAVSSFGALYGAALAAGWSRATSPLLPITVDATAAVATRVWLSPDTPTDKARRFARSVAFGAIAVSLLGNGIFHMAEAGYLRPGVWLVIGAGGTSPIALAVVAHLAVLRGAMPEAAEADILVTSAAVPESVGGVESSAVSDKSESDRVPDTPSTGARGMRAVRDGAKSRQKLPDAADGWETLLGAAQQVNAAAIAETGRPAGVSRLRADLRIGQAKAQQLRDHLAGQVPLAGHANGVPVPA
ncbi:MAG TPA: DUF2637 domain-containing protein [Actinocrinis sp.]|uniref:DUF2637 domain-containing protein n=1 Tax=Actinocrinis sp. TaxID=1920516 RepID=UPI002DDD0981|nr:DUF2637 domain-containing protein [Actinocrinis sp.]HEV3170817.1 DUF2637 domain-containing protein [Actinocrinis sp.]